MAKERTSTTKSSKKNKKEKEKDKEKEKSEKIEKHELKEIKNEKLEMEAVFEQGFQGPGRELQQVIQVLAGLTKQDEPARQSNGGVAEKS